MSEPVLRDEGVFSWFDGEDSEETENRVAGTLEIAANGRATLSLVGLLPASDKPMAALFDHSPLEPSRCILGLLKSNGIVFLRSLRPSGMTWSDTLAHQRYVAKRALVFSRLEVAPDLDSVTKVAIDIDNLGEWASAPAVVCKTTRNGATACAAKQKGRVFRLAQKTLSIRRDIVATGVGGFAYQSATLRQRSWLEVAPKSPWSLDVAREEFASLEDLLLLLADIDVALNWPTLSFGSQSARFYFEKRRSESKKVEVHDSWATLLTPSVDLGKLLSHLEEQREVLGPGLYLYLGIRRAPSLYLENRFSTAVFGIESLHRRTATVKPQTRLEQKIARILGNIEQEDDRDWLARRLKNATEPTLEERIYSTLSELDLGIEDKSLRQFARECADFRNQIAHFGGHRDGAYGPFIRRMSVLNEALRPLYHAVLLTRIGMGRDRIHAYFLRSPMSPRRRKALTDAGLVLTNVAGDQTASGGPSKKFKRAGDSRPV